MNQRLIEAAKQLKEGNIYYNEFYHQLFKTLEDVSMKECPALMHQIAESLLDHKPERWEAAAILKASND